MKDILIYQNLINDTDVRFEFALAIDLIKHFGIVAAQEAQETSAGHPALRLQTPEEVVSRAFAIAEMVVSEGVSRGWITPKQEKMGS